MRQCAAFGGGRDQGWKNDYLGAHSDGGGTSGGLGVRMIMGASR